MLCNGRGRLAGMVQMPSLLELGLEQGIGGQSKPMRKDYLTIPGPGRVHQRLMARFKLPDHAQIATIFRPKRHRLSARSYRHARADAFSLWDDYAAELAA